MNQDLRRVPLDALHRELGARMGGFAGFDMPIQYATGLRTEHLHTRERAGLFDVSHMGQLRAQPRDGRPSTLHRELEAALPVDFDDWPAGLQRYTCLLNEDGGIEDDLMLVHLDREVRIVANAGNRERDLALLAARCPGLVFEWIDAALLALQGPAAEAVLARLDPRAAPLLFMESAELELAGAHCFVTRSGYTGEDGFEISVPAPAAEAVARRLLADPDVAPAGLGARDTLRLEAGLPLHGADITASSTPVEAGLPFAIARTRRAGAPKAGGFPGADRVLRQFAEGVRRRLVGLVSYEPVPVRARTQIVDEHGREVGEVSSGTVSPTLGRPVMLAWMDAGALRASADGAFHAVVRDRRPTVHLTPLPFVPKRYKR
jgi:aminomethyltransferase